MHQTNLRRCLLAFMTAVHLCTSFASPTPAVADANEVLDRYASRRDRAATVEQALQKRIAQLERRGDEVSARIATLQQQLGHLLKDLKVADETIRGLQANVEANRSVIADSQRRVDQLNSERRQLEQQIAEEKANAWRCYLPFVAIYCLAQKLPERHKALQAQLHQTGNQILAAERQVGESRQRLFALEAERRTAGARRDHKQAEVGDAERQLTELHAALAASRSAYHRHREVLDSFSRELQQIEDLPVTERQGAIERRLVRLDLQLAREMVKACQLIDTRSSSVPASLRQACALA